MDISITGFEPVEIDQIAVDFEDDSSDPADTVEREWLAASVVSKPGDIWELGEHRLACGDARNAGDLDRLMSGKRAAMGFSIRLTMSGSRMSSGADASSMPSSPWPRARCRPASSPPFWRKRSGMPPASPETARSISCAWTGAHIGELIEAGREVYDEMLNLAVWVKSNAGQGSFYRSKHELVGVFRVGDAKHLNNVELGRHGRSRSNVWHYAGVNTFRAGRMDDLAAHPTVKPVAMVADALKDCTRRGDIVLDTFAGAGTTILAAERVGRRAYSLELEPKYVDVAIRRWQAFTRRDAVHADTGQTFEDMAGDRKERTAGTVGAKIRDAHGGGPSNETQALARPRGRRTLRGWVRQAAETHALQAWPVWTSQWSRPVVSAILGPRSEEALKEKITMREGDRTTHLSKMDAIIQVTFNKALKGDAKGLVAFLQLIRWAGLMDEQPELSSTESISAEDEAILAGYLERHGLKPLRRRPASRSRRRLRHRQQKKKNTEDKT